MKGNNKTSTPSKAAVAMKAAAVTVVQGTAMNIAKEAFNHALISTGPPVP